MVIVQGIVTGRKAGIPKENGQVFDTLQIESAGRTYYVGYERKLLPNVRKDQQIALACNVSSRNGYTNYFANGHIADECLVDLEQYTGRSVSKFDDF